MTEWLYEDGIGERRAALIDGGRIIQARIERDSDGVRAGTRLHATLASHHDRTATLASGQSIKLTRLPPRLSEGASCIVEIRRSAIPERDLVKLAVASPVTDPSPTTADAPTLLATISASGHAVRTLGAHDPDALEAAGWSELLDEAARGVIAFDGGVLRLSLTPAMAVIDIDGHLPPATLAIAGAEAAACCIVRLGIGGSTVIDLPRSPDRAARMAADTAFDAGWSAATGGTYERTATNGFGLLQIITPRRSPSIAEHLQFAPVESRALALLRRATRSRGHGAMTLTAHPAVIAWLDANPHHLATLARQTARTAQLHGDAALGIGDGDVS
jgi:hypothetical protein